jgi:predicted RNA-binding protein with PUA-like domain
MKFWLMKSEPDEVSIDHLAALPNQTVPWFGVRNYQARNFMRDAMQIGDLAFFYHSGCAEPGIAGICEVCSEPYPDETQFITPQECFLRGAVNYQKQLKNYTQPPSIEPKARAPAGVSSQLSAAQLSRTVTQKTT